MKTAASPRLDTLDTLRGLTLVSMIAYHACWDTVYMFGVDWAWYRSRGAFLWQQSICWTFILLSGYCSRLGRRLVRRGVTVFAAGALVSAVTVVFLPGNRVFWGVLSLLGASMLLTAPLKPYLSRVPAAPGLAASFALFALCYRVPQHVLGPFRLPDALYRNDFTACLGFPPRGFFSTDYFPLLPWLFLFWCGFFVYDLLPPRDSRLWRVRLPALTVLGRHSLLAYLLHQPIVYASLSALFYGGLP